MAEVQRYTRDSSNVYAYIYTCFDATPSRNNENSEVITPQLEILDVLFQTLSFGIFISTNS